VYTKKFIYAEAVHLFVPCLAVLPYSVVSFYNTLKRLLAGASRAFPCTFFPFL